MPIFGPPNIEKMKEKKNIKGLVKTLEYNRGDGSEQICIEAIRALDEIQDSQAIHPLVKRALYGTQDVKSAAIQALTHFGTPAIDTLTESLKSSSPIERRNAAQALKGFGDSAIEPLIASLSHKTPGIRQTATEALGDFQNGQSTSALIALLDDESSHVKSTAVEALKKVGEPAIELLVQALDKQTDNEQRMIIIEILGGIQDTQVIPLLKNLLKDSDVNVRKKAIQLLTQFDTPDIEEQLLPMIKDDEKDVQRAALRALKQCKVTQIDTLINLFCDEQDEEIRNAIFEILKPLRGIPKSARKRIAEIYVTTPYFIENVKELLIIYNSNPHSFIKGSGGTSQDKIRAIGQELDKIGGFELMQAAHAVFAQNCNVMGAPRNLEHMWDGIGEWWG